MTLIVWTFSVRTSALANTMMLVNDTSFANADTFFDLKYFDCGAGLKELF